MLIQLLIIFEITIFSNCLPMYYFIDLDTESEKAWPSHETSQDDFASSGDSQEFSGDYNSYEYNYDYEDPYENYDKSDSNIHVRAFRKKYKDEKQLFGDFPIANGDYKGAESNEHVEEFSGDCEDSNEYCHNVTIILKNNQQDYQEWDCDPGVITTVAPCLTFSPEVIPANEKQQKVTEVKETIDLASGSMVNVKINNTHNGHIHSVAKEPKIHKENGGKNNGLKNHRQILFDNRAKSGHQAMLDGANRQHQSVQKEAQQQGKNVKARSARKDVHNWLNSHHKYRQNKSSNWRRATGNTFSKHIQSQNNTPKERLVSNGYNNNHQSLQNKSNNQNQPMDNKSKIQPHEIKKHHLDYQLQLISNSKTVIDDKNRHQPVDNKSKIQPNEIKKHRKDYQFQVISNSKTAFQDNKSKIQPNEIKKHRKDYQFQVISNSKTVIQDNK